MKTHTSQFKQNLKNIKQIDTIITYNSTTLHEELYSVSYHYEGNLLKSVMKQLDIECTVNIPLNTVLDLQVGVKVGNAYEYLDYGNFVVTKVEKQEDLDRYTITCYDKLIYSMKQNENLNVTYPITLKNYLTALCNRLNLELKNQTFTNEDRIIQNELYLGLDYTYRDILDEIAQATGSIICISNDDKLELKYPTQTNDTIDEEYLKDINVKFGEKYGLINSIVLSRAEESDNVFLMDDQSVADNGLCEVKIKDNQIMNWNDRSDYLQGILTSLDGLYYYINDFNSIGILYYDIGDIYNITVGDTTYQCLMLNDEINITSGIQEIIHTEMPEQAETDYDKADKTDRKLNQTYIIVNKQQQTIEQLITDVYEDEGIINERFTQIYTDVNGIVNKVQGSGGNNLLKNSVMFAYDSNGIPSDWELSGAGTLSINSSPESLNAGGLSGHAFTLSNKTVKQRVYVKADSSDIPEDEKTYYTFSTRIKKNAVGTAYVKIYNDNEEYYVLNLASGTSAYYDEYTKTLLPTQNYYDIEFYGDADSGATFTDNMFALGEYKSQWQQANGEIMNTQVNISVDGVVVKSSQYEGNYTVMSPLEFSGYAKVNGVITKVFTINGDTTEVEKLESRSGITMPPIKIVPVTTGSLQGWAFVPST